MIPFRLRGGKSVKAARRRGRFLVFVLAALMFAAFLPLPGNHVKVEAASPPRVALTFDDGYGFDHRIIDFLSSQGISATAFVVGVWAQQNTHLLQEMDAQGWEICNHTHTHPWLTKVADDHIQAELNTCQSVISSATGQFQPWFRPPGGFIDGRVISVISAMGFIPVMWDLDSMDTRMIHTPLEDRINYLAGAAFDGCTILFHFGGRNTFELVVGVVQKLQERGFTFVTLGELYGWKDQVRGGSSGPGQKEAGLRHYFAEGTTRQGFEEWILVMNPQDKEVDVEAEFYSSQGVIEKHFLLPPRGRTSISVNSEVPWQDDVAVCLQSASPVAAERMLYFNRGRGFSGGTVSQGVNAASACHYFPEGTVRPGFEEYLAVFNPSAAMEARVMVEFYGAGGKLEEAELVVAPLARETVLVNEILEGEDISMVLRSMVPVVAERSEYFIYNNVITGAHCTSGILEANGEWFFAEGTTRRFFESYLTVFNPCNCSTWVKVRLVGSDGSARDEMIGLNSGERRTLHLNTYLPTEMDYSIHISSLLPIVAERTSYFQSNNVMGGYCSTGTPAPREQWLFPEGCTTQGFQEWLALFNPNGKDEEVTVEYLRGGGEAVTRSYLLPPEGRITIDVAGEAGQEEEVSIEVRSDHGVVAERSIYFSRPAW